MKDREIGESSILSSNSSHAVLLGSRMNVFVASNVFKEFISSIITADGALSCCSFEEVVETRGDFT